MKNINKRIWLGIILVLTMLCLSTTAVADLKAFESEMDKPVKEISISKVYREADCLSDSSIEYLTNPEDVAEIMRNYMENRVDTFTVYFSAKEASYEEFMGQCLELAFKETGVSTQGDYLRKHYGGYSVCLSYYIKGEYAYITATYTARYYTTAAQEQELSKKINEIIAGFNFTEETSDFTKIKTVYDYICENVVYDYDNLNDSNYKLKYTAYAALINGTSVCQGYASLLYRFMTELGIECRIISGIGNGGGHAWNIVKLDGKYYNVDATWDASYYEAISEYAYFLKCNANFDDHTRDAEFETDAFNTQYVMHE